MTTWLPLFLAACGYQAPENDQDRDGYLAGQGDCNDNDPNVGADLIDSYTDNDNDGFGTGEAVSLCAGQSGYARFAGDCNDDEAAINPAATETCDALDADEDCNGMSDDGDTSATGKTNHYPDDDGDTYGAGEPTPYCDTPAGFATNNTDCDDTSSAINPGAPEICDAADIDEDCDSVADDADASVSAAGKSSFYLDDDGDTYGDALSSTSACDQPSNYVSDNTDCDDTSAAINPDATETCDATDTDEDCDGLSDDDDTSATGKADYYADTDGDTYGAGAATAYCDPIASYVSDNTDCDDSQAAVNPGATEICDTSNTDEDCDSLADDSDPSTSSAGKTAYYADLDSDGYGDETTASTLSCDDTSTRSTDNTDCDDGDATTYPGATEVTIFDGIVNNCDSVTEGPYDAGVSGLALLGVEESQALADYSQNLVSIGDTDGDGRTDLVVGATHTGDLQGAAYMLSGINPDTLTEIDTVTDHIWQGIGSSDQLGYPVNGGFDLDSDGFSDYIISAAGAASVGRGCLIYGGSLVDGTYDSAADCSATFDGSVAASLFGTDASGGDFNGDGFDDLAISTTSGVYVFAGGTTRFSGSLSPSDADWIYTGTAGDYAGNRIDLRGDIDGDGKKDLVTTARYYGVNSAGRVYVVKGSVIPISGSLDSEAWATIDGTETNQYLSSAIASAPDMDSDGSDEILIGSEYTNASTTEEGAAYLFLSASLAADPTTTAASADYTFTGNASAYDYFGYVIATGDANADGISDILIGTPLDDTSGTDAGAGYFYDGAELLALPPGTVDMTVPAYGLVVFTGTNPGDNFCASAAFYDYDGDGDDDLAIGAPYDSTSYTDAGAVNIITSQY